MTDETAVVAYRKELTGRRAFGHVYVGTIAKHGQVPAAHKTVATIITRTCVCVRPTSRY